MKRLLSILIVTVMLVSLFPFALASAADVTAPAIALNEKKAISLSRTNVEAVFEFTAPSDGEYVFYSEGDEDTYGYVFDENGGIVDTNDDDIGYNFAVYFWAAAGSKYILRSTFYDMSEKGDATVSVVKRGAPTSVAFDETDVTLYVGEELELDYVFLPIGAYWEDYDVQSSNEAVLDSATLTAGSAGTATLTLTTESGLTATKNVRVIEKQALTLDNSVSATAEEDSTAYYTFTPEQDGNYTVKVSSDESIYILVDDGFYVSGDGGSECAVNVQLTAGIECTVAVNSYYSTDYSIVVKKAVTAEDMLLFPAQGDRQPTFMNTFVYAEALDDGMLSGITWSVSDPEIAELSVVSGYENTTLLFKKAGTVTVTATLENGTTASCDVTGYEVPDMTAAKTYTEKVESYDPLYVSFNIAEDGWYGISATDKAGYDVEIDIDGYASDFNLVKQYLTAGKYYVTALRHADYFEAEDITVSFAPLVESTGLEIVGGDTIIAYLDREITLRTATTPENGIPLYGVEWSVDSDNVSYNTENDYFRLVLHETGEYTVTATLGNMTDSVKVVVTEPSELEFNVEKEVNVTAGNVYITTFTPEKSGIYILDVSSDVNVGVESNRFSDYGSDMTVKVDAIAGVPCEIVVDAQEGDAAVTLKMREPSFPTAMQVIEKNVVLQVGQRHYCEYVLTPDEVYEQLESVVSSDTSVVGIIDDVEIVGVAPGTATVTITTEYGLTDTLVVTVVGEDYEWATDLTLDKYELDLTAGSSATVKATVEADSEKTVYWASSDKSVAIVDQNGRVTAVAPGNAYIIASVDRLMAECYVTVTAPEIKDSSKVFTDVKSGKWYTKAIDYAYSYGFIAGISKTEFGINEPITRGQFITILARIAGVDTSNAANRAATTKFTDVKVGRFYTAAIAWANANGVVAGTSDTTYSPDAPIERQALCVMIVNFAEYMGVELTASEAAITFKDASSIQKFAKKAVAICQQADIVNGYNENGGVTFRPRATATRAEAAQILYKFHKDFITR